MENKKETLEKIEAGKLDELYPLQWFRNRTKSARGPHVSSIHLAKLIYDRFRPKSLLDLGAGSCSFANTIGSFGVPAVAVDGSDFNKEFATNCEYIGHNLCRPLPDSRTFDMVTSWDVIEHIPESYERVVAKTIINAAENWIVLSIDNSSWGKYHVNNKPKSYWINGFGNSKGVEYCPELTKEVAKEIKANENITSNWYANNLLIFKKTL